MFDDVSLVEHLDFVVTEMQHAYGKEQAINIAVALLSEAHSFNFPIVQASNQNTKIDRLSVYWLIDDEKHPLSVALFSVQKGEIIRKTVHR
ncbi:hypothetical protein [Vibrio atypicus]|uniref:hypothetical protein n=1 Tax=Vibrio atypicus TaxID=558271 RepID=UPI0037363CD2